MPPCSPHTELAAYTTEHPVYRHINMRVQVGRGGVLPGTDVVPFCSAH
jgi:DNA-directed RNA polymerase subunit L